MRHTEFWSRMEQHLGSAYAHTWSREHVLSDLGGCTVDEALARGESTKKVWRAVWEALELPASER